MTATDASARLENRATPRASTRSPVAWLAWTAVGSTYARLISPPIQAATARKCNQSTPTARYDPDRSAAAWLLKLLVNNASPVATIATWPGQRRTPRHDTKA